jgi:hypothetical protein
MRERFEVKKINEKTFGLYIDGILLGTSKAHFDCDLAREVILKSTFDWMTL